MTMIAAGQRPAVLMLAPILSRRQAGASHAMISITNALQRRGIVDVTVVADEVEYGVLHPDVKVLLTSPVAVPRGLWRLGRGPSVRRFELALRAVRLPPVDALYTQSLEGALAFRRIDRRTPIISHIGHVLAEREAREESDLQQPWRTIDAWFAERFERRSYRSRAWTHVVSTPLVARTRAEHFHLPASFFQVQPLCVDIDRFSDRRARQTTRDALSIRPSDCVIASVARMVPWKNLDWLIRSVELLPEQCHLVLVGTGDQEPALRALAARSSSKARIHLVGHQDPVPYLAAADIFALPSAIESFGIAYAEAMCMELPCVGLRYAPPYYLSAAQDVIVDGKTGSVVSDEEEFTRVLTRLSADPDERRQLGRGGRERALSRYSADAYATFLETQVALAARAGL